MKTVSLRNVNTEYSKIKSFEGADDYAAMREVIYRRFRHALEEEEQVEKGTLLKRNAKFFAFA